MSFLGRGTSPGRSFANPSEALIVGADDEAETVVLALIDRRRLERECFARVVRSTRRILSVTAHETAADWLAAPAERRGSAVLLNLGSRRPDTASAGDEIRELVAAAGPVPVVVVAEAEDAAGILAAVAAGARGYVPASVGLDAIAEAALLASRGGSFLPASAIAGLRSALRRDNGRSDVPAAAPDNASGQFTSRQAAVADALRRGKANKIIAYELNMCESTVKVHIRTIMKKLRASNRTQAAFKLNTMMAAPAGI